MSRQDRKVARRALEGASRTLVERGLRRPLREDDLLALAYTFNRTLLGPGTQGGAAAMAALAWRVYQTSIAADPARQEFACRRGCDHCCRANCVSVTVPEAFGLANALVDPRNREVRAAFERGAPLTVNLGPAERFGRKIPCAFLADGACSVYASRPLACRRVVSFTVEPCIEELNGQPGDMVVPGPPIAHAVAVQLALLAGLAAAGPPPVLLEMSSAVTRILATPDAEHRWLAGEDVFSGVLADPIDDATARDRIESVRTALARILPG